MKILAIDPGTRAMGVALLDGKKLIYHAVKTVRKLPSPQERLNEGRKIVLRLINDFRPTVLALEETFFANNMSAALLNSLVNEIKAVGKRKRLTVISLAANTVKKRVCGNGWAGKQEVGRAVIARYQELGVYFRQDRKWKERYHQNMFDAVALGMVVGMKETDNRHMDPARR